VRTCIPAQCRGQADSSCSGEDSSSRYVAEENIEIISIDKKVADGFPLEAGRYFKRWDDDQKVFISNIRSDYRED
jgi:F-box protein 21